MKVTEKEIPREFRKGETKPAKNVGELIELLKQLPPRLKIYHGFSDSVQVVVTQLNGESLRLLLDEPEQPNQMKINPNEAPEGYFAEAKKECIGCAFFSGMDCSRPKLRCISYERKDGCDVIFKKREELPKSTPSRADEYALFQELLRIAGSLNRSNNIVRNIQRLEEIAEDLTQCDYATPRKSFAQWVEDKLNEEANPLATTGETD